MGRRERRDPSTYAGLHKNVVPAGAARGPHDSSPPSTTLSDPVNPASGLKILDLYFSVGSSMLPLGGKRSFLGGSHTADALARSVQGLFWSSSSGDLLAALCRGAVVRQRPQVDAGDVGPADGPGPLPSLPALHHTHALGCWRRLETSALGAAGTAGSAGSGRHRFPQTGPALRRSRPSVLRHP